MFPFRITSEFKTSEHESRVSLLIEYSSSQQVALARSLKIQGTLYVDVIVKFGADRSIGYSSKVRRGMGRGGRRGGRGTTSHRFLDACRLKKKKTCFERAWNDILLSTEIVESRGSSPLLPLLLFLLLLSQLEAMEKWKSRNFFFLSLISFPTFERKIVFVDYHIRTITEKRN